MSKKIILNIVIILGILILFAFLTVFYGIYLKISSKGNRELNSSLIFSSNLENNENIIDIEVIDKNKLLILIEKEGRIKGAIYEINKNQIISYIDR